jgi:hypothetical protein
MFAWKKKNIVDVIENLDKKNANKKFTFIKKAKYRE